MQFKGAYKERLEKEYEDLSPVLKMVLEILDRAVEMYQMWNNLKVTGVVITSLFRDDPKSYHSKMKAVDIRTWSMSKVLREACLSLLRCLSQLYKSIDYEYEDTIYKNGKIVKGEHIHIKLDDGSLRA